MPHKDLDKRRQYHREYNKTHPVALEKQREYQKRYLEKHPEARLRAQKYQTTSARRERRYRLTPERFEAVMAAQNGLCGICGLRPPRDVDHSRKTGHFRGLLCRSCNLGIGMFADDPEIMSRAIAYVKRPTVSISESYPQKKRFTKPYPRGERCHSSKLTDEIVRAIRNEYAAGGTTYPKLALKYGIHHVHLARVIRHEIWSHVE